MDPSYIPLVDRDPEYRGHLNFIIKNLARVYSIERRVDPSAGQTEVLSSGLVETRTEEAGPYSSGNQSAEAHTTEAHLVETPSVEAHTSGNQSAEAHSAETPSVEAHTSGNQSAEAHLVESLSEEPHATEAHTPGNQSTKAHSVESNTGENHTTESGVVSVDNARQIRVKSSTKDEPAFYTEIDSSDSLAGYVKLLRCQPCPVHYSTDEFQAGGHDTSQGLHCEFWPTVADAWACRDRPHGWPSATTVQATMAEGYCLVPATHSLSAQPNLEWRLDFTAAQHTLVKSFSEEQTLCHMFLDMIYSHVLKPLESLTSEHMNTCFFWVCENTDEETWAEESLGECLVMVLERLILFLESKCIPCYFIPEHNLVDHLSEEQITAVLKKLYAIHANPWNYLLEQEELYCPSLHSQYDTLQTALAALELKSFTPRNHFTQPPGLLHQLLDLVLEDVQQGSYKGTSQLVCGTRLACVLILVQGGDLSALRATLDLLDLLEDQQALPDAWTPAHDAAFTARLAHHMVLAAPKSIQGFCNSQCISFLEHVKCRTNVVEPTRDHIFLSTLVQMCLCELNQPDSENEAWLYHCLSDCLQHLQHTATASLLKALYLRQQGKDKEASHMLRSMAEEEHKTKSKVWFRTRATHLTQQNPLFWLRQEAEAIAKDLQHDSELSSLLVGKNDIEAMLVSECGCHETGLVLPTVFLAGYLLCTAHQNNTDIPKSVLDSMKSEVAEDPAETFLLGYCHYLLGQCTEAVHCLSTVIKVKPHHVPARLLLFLCSWKQESMDENTCKQNTITEDSDWESELGEDSDCDQLDKTQVHIMLTLANLKPGDLDNLQEALLREPPYHSAAFRSAVSNCIGRYLHSLAHQCDDEAEKSKLLTHAERRLKKALELCKESDAAHKIFYLNFLWKEQMVAELTKQLRDLSENQDWSSQPGILFVEQDAPVLPEFLHPALEITPEIHIPCSAYVKYLQAAVCNLAGPFQTPEDTIAQNLSFEPMEYEPFFDKLSSFPRWHQSMDRSVTLNLGGQVYFLMRQYAKARELFIQATHCSQSNQTHSLQQVRRCEDRQIRQAMLHMLQEDFTTAYDTYSRVWKEGLPRCAPDCSLLLHLSEELLQLAQQDDRALRLAALYLQHALMKDQEKTSPTHRAQAMTNLGCLYYWLSQTCKDEEDSHVFKESCEKCLRESLDLADEGSTLTLLGNYLVLEDRYDEALPVLAKAIAKGSKDLPITELEGHLCPHHTQVSTRHYRMEHFLPVEPIFKLLVCTCDDYYGSYLMYALHLRNTVNITLGRDCAEHIQEMTETCDQVDHCPGKYSLLAIAHLLTGQYESATQYFEKELCSDAQDEFKKHELILQLKLLSDCCFKLQKSNNAAASTLVRQWLHVLASSRTSLVSVSTYMTHHIVDDLSLALFMTTQLPQTLSLQSPDDVQVMTNIYDFLQNELRDHDPMVDGLGTNVAILLSENYDSLEEGPEKEVMAERVTSAFLTALSKPDSSLSTTRLAFASFLLTQRKWPEALEQSGLASDMAMRHIEDILKRSIEKESDIMDEEHHLLDFYLQKSLIPATDHQVICHTLLHDFEKAFACVDKLLAYLLRAQAIDVDPLAYLIKYTQELPRFGASIATVIDFHKGIIHRYQYSKFIPTIYNNLGCMLFAHARQLEQEGSEGRLLQQAKESFQEALDYEGITMALYADYANFLYNTHQLETALTVICESDDLADSAQGSNAYGHEERMCVDECIRGLIDDSPSGKFLTDSHFYIQYLRVAVLISLKKDASFIESELQVLQEDGEQKHIGCLDVLCGHLTHRLKTEVLKVAEA